MTVEDVTKRLLKIHEVSNDSEKAHSEEDTLHISVLIAISKGAENPSALAKEALKTMKIDFRRWYA